MDTSSNNKFSLKKLFSNAWGVLLFLLLFAIISVSIYTPIKNNVFEDSTKKYIESNSFIYSLTDLTRYLKETKIDNTDRYDSQYENLKNIKYYIGKKDQSAFYSNIPDATEAILQNELNNSQFYLSMKTDEKGNPEIESSYYLKNNKNAFIDGLNIRNENALEYANLIIFYSVPKNLTADNDLFIYNIKSFNIEQYMILILIIGALGLLLLTIISFAIPYTSQKKASIVRLFNKMFLELKLFTLFAFAIGSYAILNIIDTGYYFDQPYNLMTIIHDANEYFYIIGIPVTFILYLLAYLSICYIKHLYHEGFIEGFIKNSIFGKILFYILKGIKNLGEEIIEIDIPKKYQAKFLIALGINLIVLCIIALAGPLGLVLALAYTIALFIYLIKLIDKIKSLNIYSSQLAKGDFNAVLPEDIGILNPIARNLNNIKSGFKVAVEKEIKSQHMKTELISNVSHDLKTPLTSIITYVDLLKCEDVTQESQKEYIDILDKKSKRLQVLIEDLFEASKASSGNIDLQLEQVDVIALLRQTLGELEEKINDSNLQMKINLPENKVLCELDGRRTYRVFENIIGNILKYALPNSRVYIDVLENEKQISFIFKNISAYEMNFDASEIMERFSRGDDSRNTEGSGLGLSIAKSLVELQNGNLQISIDGDLFKLTVTFPKV